MIDERQHLIELLPRNAIGAEIGVHKGDFARRLIVENDPRELHLIDPWQYRFEEVYLQAWYGGLCKEGQRTMENRYGSVCRKFAERKGQVFIHRGDSSSVLPHFGDDHFDWVYIDGDHLYPQVKQDLELSFAKTKVGGLITGDDYGRAGWWDDGVTKAVDEFSDRKDVESVYVRGHQFVFRKLEGQAA